MAEQSIGLRCGVCPTTWPTHGNVVDFHPERSLSSVEPIGPLKRLSLIPDGSQPIEQAWLERCARWVESGRHGLHLTSPWMTACRWRWSPDEGVALFCRGSGELSLGQQWAALWARNALVVKCYPMGTWERLTVSGIQQKVVRKLLHIGLMPCTLLQRARKRWTVRRTLTRVQWAEVFWTRAGLPRGGMKQTVLDLGCGWGRYAALVNLLGHQVIGIDPQAYPETWRRMVHGWFCRGTDADLTQFRSQSVDGCLCIEVLQYLRDDRQTLQELHRVLKVGGWLLLQVTNRDNPWTRRTGRWLLPGDPVQRYYTETDLLRLVESAGFQVERSWAEGVVSPVMPRLAAWFTEVLLLARWVRWLERLISERYRKLLWVLARRVCE